MGNSRLENLIVQQDIFGHGIGVHYRGSETYQTRLGAFFTFAIYGLMLANLVTLWTAFMDGSNQTEKVQTLTFDAFGSEQYNISENKFDIRMLTIPTLEPSFGSFKLTQNINGEKNEVLAETCSDEVKADQVEYWAPRMGINETAATYLI